MADVERQCQVDVALRWVKGYDTTIVSFVNTIPTREGGTHVAGFERAMTKAVNDSIVANNRKLAKLAKSGKDRAEKADIQEGLVAALKVTFPEPQFRGQTKGELGTPGVQSIVYDVVKDGLTGWFEGSGQEDPRRRTSARRSPRRSSTASRRRPEPRGQAQGGEPRLGRHARQAGRLPHPRTRRRAADRRGRLRRRPRQGRAQQRVHGRPAAPRQGRQRRQVQPQAGRRERRGPGAVHGHRRRVGPRLQARGRPLRPHHHPVRRRRRRQPHPLPAAHPHLPLHATAPRGRTGVRGPAAALHGQGRATRCTTRSPTTTRNA